MFYINSFRMYLGDGHGRRAAALVALGGDDLIVELAQVHAERLPRVEVVARRHRAARAVRLPDAPVLVERRRARDRRLVHALRLVNVVRAAVGGHGALVREPAGRVVRPKVLGDVVLDERVRRPAVHGEVRVAGRLVVGVEVDRPARTKKKKPSANASASQGTAERARRTGPLPGSSPCRRQSCRSSAS
jgi:hypothetical protein